MKTGPETVNQSALDAAEKYLGLPKDLMELDTDTLERLDALVRIRMDPATRNEHLMNLGKLRRYSSKAQEERISAIFADAERVKRFNDKSSEPTLEPQVVTITPRAEAQEGHPTGDASKTLKRRHGEGQFIQWSSLTPEQQEMVRGFHPKAATEALAQAAFYVHASGKTLVATTGTDHVPAHRADEANTKLKSPRRSADRNGTWHLHGHVLNAWPEWRGFYLVRPRGSDAQVNAGEEKEEPRAKAATPEPEPQVAGKESEAQQIPQAEQARAVRDATEDQSPNPAKQKSEETTTRPEPVRRKLEGKNEEKPDRPAILSPDIPQHARKLLDEAGQVFAETPSQVIGVFKSKLYAERVELAVCITAALVDDKAFAGFCQEREVEPDPRPEGRWHTVLKALWPQKLREKHRQRISEEAEWARAVVTIGKVPPERDVVKAWILKPGSPAGYKGRFKTGQAKLDAFRAALPDVQSKADARVTERALEASKYVAENVTDARAIAEGEIGEDALGTLINLDAERRELKAEKAKAHDVKGPSVMIVHWLGGGRYKLGELITTDPIRIAAIHERERGSSRDRKCPGKPRP